MNADTTIYTLKGHAQRLQKSLAALDHIVSHAQALDLVAQMHGKRNWKELTGLAQADETHKVQQDAEQSAWLNRLFYVLRLTADADTLQQVLDDYVLDLLPPDMASSVNNQGMHTQLAMLLEEEKFNRKALVGSLEQELNRKLAMPEGTPPLAMLPERVIEASLMVCYGFPEEMEHQFDALDWALQATAEDLAAVVRGNYRSCDATDEIGLWMEQHAPNLEERAKIHKLLEAMRTIVESKPDRTGITLNVDADSFAYLVWLRHQYEGLKFDDALIEMLDLDED